MLQSSLPVGIKLHFRAAFFILFLGLYFGGFTAKSQVSNLVVIGHKDTIYSKTLNETREIWMHVPQSARNNANPKKRYPVIYLLDGNAHFTSVVGMIQQLSSVNGNTICPEMIVVGITNTDRTRDLTPTQVAASGFGGNTGGGDKFIDFIETELMPYVNTTYPTAPYKILIGHSLGGLMAMDVLMNHTNLFNAYLSIDPSMHWDKRKLQKSMTESLPAKKLDGVSLYLACANTMPEGMDVSKAYKDSTKITEHIRAILETDRLLKRSKKNNLNYKFKYYKDEDHGSLPLIATYDALHYFFEFYKLDLSTEERNNLNRDVVAKIENHYRTLSKKFGYVILMPEEFANGLGYQLLARNEYDVAEYVFRMNITNYPGSSNVYDSMGDCYLAKGEKEKAIASFKKALSMEGSVPETKAKLEALLKG